MGEFGTKICKSSAHFGTYVGEFGAYLGELHGDFGSEVGELHGNFATEIGELKFHLGLGEDGGRGDVVFGREAVPVDGRNGVHQLGRVFFAKDADEFVRDAKPSCFIKSHCAVFLRSFQGAVKNKIITGHDKCGKDTPFTAKKNWWQEWAGNRAFLPPEKLSRPHADIYLAINKGCATERCCFLELGTKNKNLDW